jgi:hypothetical protein
MVRIHINLNDVKIQKTDIDKLVYGLYKHVSELPQYLPPYLFTANVACSDTKTTCNYDIGYLSVLKNNNVQLTDDVIGYPLCDVLIDSSHDKIIKKALITPIMPIFHSICDTKVCTYIDWDNMQVISECISAFIKGIQLFIQNIKVHHRYFFYTFVHSKTSKNIKHELKKNGVYVINIIKDKTNSGDEEMMRFIRNNSSSTDSICIASGDRDFSPLMVKYVREKHNVFLKITDIGSAA